MNIQNKRELQQIALINSSDIEFKDFMNLKNALQNHIRFELLMVLFFMFQKESVRKNIKTNHGN